MTPSGSRCQRCRQWFTPHPRGTDLRVSIFPAHCQVTLDPTTPLCNTCILDAYRLVVTHLRLQIEERERATRALRHVDGLYNSLSAQATQPDAEQPLASQLRALLETLAAAL